MQTSEYLLLEDENLVRSRELEMVQNARRYHNRSSSEDLLAQRLQVYHRQQSTEGDNASSL